MFSFLILAKPIWIELMLKRAVKEKGSPSAWEAEAQLAPRKALRFIKQSSPLFVE